MTRSSALTGVPVHAASDRLRASQTRWIVVASSSSAREGRVVGQLHGEIRGRWVLEWGRD
jgi:hypothetical protein